MSPKKNTKPTRKSKIPNPKEGTTHTANTPVVPTRTTWDNARTDIAHRYPWESPGLTTAEVFSMFAKEAKACVYELHRAYVEVFYKREGWPAEPNAWEPLEKERDALVCAHEQPPDQDGIGTRYGITYGELRYGEHYPNKVIPLDNIGTTPDQKVNRLTGMWIAAYFAMIRKLLLRDQYAEGLKDEIRTAFADFKDFGIGSGIGASVMQRLRNDEEGIKALAMTEGLCTEINRRLTAIEDEPFGIERDFTHLWHTARFGLNVALLHNTEDFQGIIRDQIGAANGQLDTLGVEPWALYSEAEPREHTQTPDLHQVLDKWGLLYLERVDAIAHRWKEKSETDEVNARISDLCEQVREWQPYKSLVDGVKPADRTAAEGAQRRIAAGIQAHTNEQTKTGHPVFTWKGHPHELYELVDELIGKCWLEVPKNRGKVSRDELARRVHQAFDFSSGEVLTPATAQSYLKKTGPRPTQGVNFQLPKNPRSEPS